MLPTTRRPSTPGPFSPEYRGEGETFAQWFPVEAAVGDLRSMVPVSKQQSETFAQWFQGRRLRGDSGLWNGMPLA